MDPSIQFRFFDPKIQLPLFQFSPVLVTTVAFGAPVPLGPYPVRLVNCSWFSCDVSCKALSENDLCVSNKADMEQGLNGVKLALKVLRDYYVGDDKAHISAGQPW